MKNKKIKIWFSDFWNGFDPYNNYFANILQNHFEIKIDPKPDILIHSVYSKDFLKYRCLRICFTGENTRPDFNKSDFHIGFDYIDDPRYLRWPLYLLYYPPENLLLENLQNTPQKKRFCSFVVSNSEARERIIFFNELNKFKKVDSGGRHLNNVGHPVKNKIEFIKESRFNIAFENESYPGYTTEKIYEAFIAGSIPIYWGNHEISRDFNPKSFINAHDFKNFTELANYVIQVDNDSKLYESYKNEPLLLNNTVPDDFQISKLVDFFRNIFNYQLSHKPIASHIDIIEFHTYFLRRRIFQFRKKYF